MNGEKTPKINTRGKSAYFSKQRIGRLFVFSPLSHSLTPQYYPTKDYIPKEDIAIYLFRIFYIAR
jgi:hypothetical protein